MDALNAAFVGAGGLAFDIGAHVGDRTASFRRLGAHVVAFEPQPLVHRALRLIHGRDGRVSLHRAAVGAAEGEIELHLNSANPTVTTASRAFVEAARDDAGWRGQVWDSTLRVPVTTLDALIDAHGIPDFVKIDVEGHEAEVLAGLSRALPALSVEVTMVQREVGHACLARLGALARYEFNLSLGEEHRLRFDPWLEATEMARVLEELPQEANSGDVYARLKGGEG